MKLNEKRLDIYLKDFEEELEFNNILKIPRNFRRINNLKKELITENIYKNMPIDDLLLIEQYNKFILSPIKPKDKIETKQLKLINLK